MDDELSVASKIKVDFLFNILSPQSITFLNSILGINVAFRGQILTTLVLCVFSFNILF